MDRPADRDLLLTTPWHAMPSSAVIDAVHGSERGLASAEAKRRLEHGGPNVIREERQESFGTRFMRQFESPLIYLLVAAAVAVLAIGEISDATIIALVLLFNAAVGVLQEGRAERTLHALSEFSTARATVLRDDVEIDIDDRELAAGDVVIVREGERVPADARLISAYRLETDEAALTGESSPVVKSEKKALAADAPITERATMIYKGTTVVAGEGRAVVVAVGRATYIGSIAARIAGIRSEIPLERNIRSFSRMLVAAVLIAAVLLFLFGIFAGISPIDMFATVVSLTVSVIPEGLPVVLTLVLATGVWRMSKRNALVKKIQAVEALGQTRVLAVDKTGTLTKNEMVVVRAYSADTLFTVEDAGYEVRGRVLRGSEPIEPSNHPELLHLGKAAALASSARILREPDQSVRIAGDPTEAAAVVFAEKLGFHRERLAEEEKIVREEPFDHRKKYSAAAYLHGGVERVAYMGAPEVILKHAHTIGNRSGARELTDETRARLADVYLALARQGLRVLALADSAHADDSLAPERLEFLGFLGIADPLRKEARSAIERAEGAGMRVVMVTGDHEVTARAIAREAGIYEDGARVTTGAEIDRMSAEDLQAVAADTRVYARVTPEHKLRIIEAYKARGEIVAMTGDGVNDAPSLVAADLGVAMGSIGTEVAKEAADIVLLDDNLGSIVAAIEEGRSIYTTIQKVMLYLFSTSLGEAATIAGALFVGLPLPVLPVQIIWLNFVTDGFLDVALAMEPKDHNLLSGRFPKPSRFIVSLSMIRRMIIMAAPMTIGSIGLYAAYLELDPMKASTIALSVLAVFQWLNAWNCRSRTRSIFVMDPFTNLYLMGATALVVAFQLAAVYAPFLQAMLHTVPLNANDWVIVCGTALSIVFVEELRKALYRFVRAPGAPLPVAPQAGAGILTS